MNAATGPITVRKALEKTPGVKSVRADLNGKTASVEYDPGITSPEKLTAATASAGYPSTVRLGK